MRLFLGLSQIALLAGCGSDTPTPPTDTPAMSISVSQSALSIVPGATGSVTVNLTRTGGFTGAVSVAAEGLPTGVTVAPGTIAAGQTSATMSFVSTAATAAGASSVTLRASGTGIAPATATVALTMTAAATPAISIAVSPTTLNVTPGGSGTLSVTLTRSGGFTGDVTIAAEGLPAGMTIANTTIAAGQTSATLTVSATAAAAAATSTITFRASGTGVTSVTSTAAITVAPPTSAGAFTLALSPTTVSIAAGGSSTVNVTLARTGSFTGAVALAVTGVPTGVTATLSSASVTGTTATLTLAAAAGVTAGTSTVTVRGSGTGVTDQTGTVAVTLTTGGTSGNVTWTFCGTSGLPIWVAAQDGTGAWTRVTGNASNAYSFQVTSKGGIAYVTANGTTGFDLDVFYGTKDELTSRGTELCGGAAGAGKSVTTMIAGVSGPTTDLYLASLGMSPALITAPNVAFSNVASGNVDLLASRSKGTFSGTGVSFTLDKLILRRALNPAAGSVLPALNFDAAEAFAPVTSNVTIGNLNGDISLVVGTYFTANNSFGVYNVDPFGSTAATRPYFGIPAGSQATGDIHFLNVTALASLTPAGAQSTRNAGLVFKDATARQITLGPVLTTPTVSVIATTPYARLRSVFTVQTEYNRSFVADFQQSGSSPRTASIQQTGGYGNTSPLTIEIPDFSAVSGWDNNWGLKAGTAVNWTMSATGWAGTGGTVTAPLVEGSTYLSATRQGTITP